MKKKSILTTILLVFSLTSMAQNSYRELLLTYFNLEKDSSFVATRMSNVRPSLTEINKKKMVPFNADMSDRLINKYLDERGFDFMFENTLLPVFQKHVSEEELRELMDLQKMPEWQKFQNMSNLQSSSNTLAMTGVIVSSMLSIVAGKTPEPVKPDKGISKKYIKLFNQYYDEVGMETILDGIFSKLIEASQDQEYMKKAGDVMKTFTTYMSKNFRVMMLNMVCDTWTEDDLKFGIKIASKPAVHHSVDAIMEIVGSLDPKGNETDRKFLKEYSEWLDKELPSL